MSERYVVRDQSTGEVVDSKPTLVEANQEADKRNKALTESSGEKRFVAKQVLNG
jgi:hypothetical protein